MKTLRRNRIDLMTPAEVAIQNAISEVEKAGANWRLTEAVVLLGKAKEMVSDYVDNNLRPEIDVDINYDFHEGRGENNELL
jgi:hypothetical protein